jgi:hypothetical protein
MTSEEDGPDSDEEPDGKADPFVDGADPLDELSDGATGHEGDPFAGLGEWEGAESVGLDEEADADGDATMPGEFEPVGEPDVASFDVDEPPESDPFSEMTPEFAELDLGDVDEDEIWEALSAAEARGSVADIQDRTYAEVSKHSYCEQCEYLTDPPETACTNEGTEILAFTDMDTVRVVDCPVVAERRRLEEEH